MNTQRDLKIARSMKLNIVSEDPLRIYHDGVTHSFDTNNPAILQMIEDWVVENGYRIVMTRSRGITSFDINQRFSSIIISFKNKSKPLAFLMAVEQLVNNLKEKP